MGWDKHRYGAYYTRSYRHNGRVVREYIGAGEKGAQTAAEDAARRQEERARREALRAEQRRVEEVEAAVRELCAWGRLLEHAAVVGSRIGRNGRREGRQRT